MGCKESKLAAATIEPVKRPKSASSRSSSRRIDRLDSNTTTTTTTTTTSVATTVAYNEKATNVAEGDEHKKAVELKACQTTGYCSEERNEEKSKNGLIGSNEGGNDVVVSEKETVEDEGDEKDESLVFGEEDKKVESVMVEENENKGEMGKEMKEVEAFEGREQDEVKIEEEEAQKANDQVQATKVEEAQAGKPSEPKAKAETMVAEEKEEAQYPNDKVEVVEEKGEAQVANDNVEVAEEEEEFVEPIEVETETETVVKDETEKIVSSNVDDQVHVAKQGEARDHDGELSEVEAETMVAEDRGEAPNVNDNVMVVEKEEAERTKVEFETKSEEETEMIVRRR